MPRISVIIPTYNRANLVAEAIESVLNQTYTDFELIVIDDGSTDNTEEVVRSITDPRLRYLKQLNKGPSAARNIGIQISTGDFVAFLDSDDLWLPEKLERQIARLDHGPEVGLVYSLYYSAIFTEDFKRLSGMCYPQLSLRQLLFGTAFPWPTVIISLSWVKQVCGFDEQLPVGEEWDLTIRLALAGCIMVCVPQPLAIIRQQANSLAKNLYVHEDSLLMILDNAFNDPRMPDELRDLQDWARASQLLRIAASAYVTSQVETGRDYLKRAIESYPVFASENNDFLVDTLVYRIRGLSLDDPEKVLQRVTQYLPGDDLFLKNLRRRLWGKFYEIAAFESYQLGQRARCIAYVIRAVTKTPSCLRNRGLFSILMRSLVGNGIIDIFKDLSSALRRSEA